MQFAEVLVGAFAGSGVTLLVLWLVERWQVAARELPDVDT